MRLTVAENAWTWVFVVALPITLVAVDPAVFRSSSIGPAIPILGAFKPLGYAGMATGVAAALADLLLKRRSAFVAGLLGAVAVFSAAVTVVLLPFSMIGTLVFGVGLLGLTPAITCAVVGSRARVTYREAAPAYRRLAAAGGALLFAAVCLSAQWRGTVAVQRAAEDVMAGQPKRTLAGIASLSRWRPIVDLRQLVFIWASEQDPMRRQRLGTAYQELTGENIESLAFEALD